MKEVPAGERVFVVKSQEKIAPTETFDKEKFIKKVADGYESGDAAIVAGYTGSHPHRFGEIIRNEPEVKATLESIFEKKSRMILKRIKPKSTEKASLVALATAAAIMARNAREERDAGKPQQHVHVHVDYTKLSSDELRRHLAEKSRTSGTGRK